jgi:hypothetical protein
MVKNEIEINLDNVFFDIESWESFLWELFSCDSQIDTLISPNINTILLPNKPGIKMDKLCANLESALLKKISPYISDVESIGRWLVSDNFEFKFLVNKDLNVEMKSENNALYRSDNDEMNLSIKLQNDITTYLHYSLPLCIISSKKEMLPWLNGHFIEICSRTKSNGYVEMEFVETSNIFNQLISNVFLGYGLLENVDILDYVIDKLNRGLYIIIHMDEYYLPNKASFQKKHFVHATLIYGYDNKNRKIKGIGFNSSHLFAMLEFDYDIFKASYEMGKIHYKESAWWAYKKAVQLIGLNKSENILYNFSIESFAEKLYNYLFSIGDSSSIIDLIPDEKVVFGVNTYNVLIENLCNVLEGRVTIDYRAIHLMYEHKKGLYNKLKFLASEFNISDELKQMVGKYVTVVRQFEEIRLNFIKVSLVSSNNKSIFHIPKDKQFYISTVEMLRKTEKNEKLILLKILGCLARDNEKIYIYGGQ